MQIAKNKIHSHHQIVMCMNKFKPIEIKDKDLINSYIIPSDEQDCDLSFANLFTWHFQTDSSYAIIQNNLVIRFSNPDEGHEYYLPFGNDNCISAIEELKKTSLYAGERLCLRGITPQLQEKLEQYNPTLWDYSENRDYFDYIYSRQELAELKGKNYQPKRNHVNKFRKSYKYTYEPLIPSAIPECLEFESAWCMKHGYIENDNIRNERRSLTTAFKHWNELDLTGFIIRIEGKIIAFTFGHPINHNTFGIHYEKADVNIDGAYSAINQHFAASLPEQYIYLNREEDLGIPGLRQAKLSYHPVKMLKKARAILKH